MNKANHTVTVPREYLEELERFRAENDYVKENIQGMLSNDFPSGQTLILRENKLTGSPSVMAIVVVDSDGRELMRYKRF